METADVIVVGSGAGGLTAALRARASGAERVTVIEKTDKFGGTSSVSGGSLWIPQNEYMSAAGIADSREDALSYLQRLRIDGQNDERLAAFVDTAPEMLAFVTEKTSLSFYVNKSHADYQPALAGAVDGGRTLQENEFDSNRLGEYRTRLRGRPNAVPINKMELDTWGEEIPSRWDWDLLRDRDRRHIVTMGTALVGGLLEACIASGIDLVPETKVLELHRDGERVDGVVRSGPSGDNRFLQAKTGVILASGGFEWNSDLVTAFLGVPMTAPASPPANTGDLLRAALTLGAGLENMTEAWWAPMMHTVGEHYDGKPLFRTTKGMRALPGGLIVNRDGRRFVNEAMNYNDLSKSLMIFDPERYSFANLPAWFICDQAYRETYSIGPVAPGSPNPEWIHSADTLRDLAGKLELSAEGLQEQVHEFNQHAGDGNDPAFHRGQSSYDRYRGDPCGETGAHNLRPLGGGPYHAVEILLGCVGTKGGLTTDAHGRVQSSSGRPIPGLYACGNVAASIFGPGYPGAGAPLASAMTWGYLAADAASVDAGVAAAASHG